MSYKDDKTYFVFRDDAPAKAKDELADLNIDVKKELDTELEAEGIAVSEDLIMRTLNAASAGVKPRWSSPEIEGLEEELAKQEKRNRKEAKDSKIVEMSDVERDAVSKVKRKHRIHILKNIGYVAAGLLILLVASNIERIIPGAEKSTNDAAMYDDRAVGKSDSASQLVIEMHSGGDTGNGSYKPSSAEDDGKSIVAEDAETVTDSTINSGEESQRITLDFEAEVVEVKETYILVKNDSGHEYVVTITDLEDVSGIEKGTRVKIYFSGGIAESYPMQIKGLEKIEVIE